MKSNPRKMSRCAIYTRKSTEHGLELEFNSLDAQREACEAYIKSQASEGWKVVPQRYDDPAYSGGNMERPALRQLLKDIDAGLIDVVVVYKIDRLTRALADFAKLVEAFDAKSISFVAVTQQFNTTTSMGRLTLNVLLSFAQFERELSSERVRDKIAASRRKGKWTGGTVPLGYEVVDKKLVINEAEAKTVRLIYDQYLSLKSIEALVAELDSKRIVTKARRTNGKSSGGVGFAYGSLAYLLKNRTYLGEVRHNGSWFPGEHEALVDRSTFGRVQELIKHNSISRAKKRHDNQALLAGILFDDRGNRMSPSFTTKKGVRYSFYVSTALLRGRKSEAGSVARISASRIENLIIRALSAHFKTSGDEGELTPSETLHLNAERITISANKVSLKPKENRPAFDVMLPSTSPSTCIEETTAPATETEPDPKLVHSIVQAHAWIDLLMKGTFSSVEDVALAKKVHPKIIRNRIRLAFMSPNITEAILSGSQPQQLKLRHFTGEVPLSWQSQRDQFGVA